jgi:D-glycero-D-manno-heptose 1,7-bisphosphate phosphatase
MDGRTAAVFLDRDGVIIVNRGDYVREWAHVTLLPRAVEALRDLNAAGVIVVLVSNQSAVGRGIISLRQAIDLNSRIVEHMERLGGAVDSSYMCPHAPDDGCPCRKPKPGMLVRAASDLGLDLERSWMIGDALTDVQAALAAGVRPVLVRTGRGQDQAPLLGEDRNSCLVTSDLGEAVDHILAVQ